MNDTYGPKAYISSTTASGTVSVLLLPTGENRNVPFALEFRNDSGESFYGINRCEVRPGMHFYLLGNLEMDSGTSPAEVTLSRVFTSDRVTTVRATVASLENAHVVLPDIREVQLSIGVDVKMEWDQTTPSTVEIK